MTRVARRAGALLFTLSFLGVVQTACVGECNDCGECAHVGGPNQGDSLGSYAAGADPDGTPTVQLTRYKDGECAGENGPVFWVQLTGDTLSVVPAPEGAVFDREAVTSGGSGKDGSVYNFVEPAGLSVLLSWKGDDAHMAFSMNGQPLVTATCTLSGDNAIACTEE